MPKSKEEATSGTNNLVILFNKLVRVVSVTLKFIFLKKLEGVSPFH